jgi:hypothetical protein
MRSHDDAKVTTGSRWPGEWRYDPIPFGGKMGAPAAEFKGEPNGAPIRKMRGSEEFPFRSSDYLMQEVPRCEVNVSGDRERNIGDESSLGDPITSSQNSTSGEEPLRWPTTSPYRSPSFALGFVLT